MHQCGLLDDAGWKEAMEGCDLVCHCASPFPIGGVPLEELLPPAREGTLRVLKFAKAAGVRRVVVTSSVAAISGGRETGSGPGGAFHEEDWSVPEKCQPYTRSKVRRQRNAIWWTSTPPPHRLTLSSLQVEAERAARDWCDANDLEMVAINPVYVQGPILAQRHGASSSSATLCKRLLNGSMPATPRIGIAAVDVRDVADAHVKGLSPDLPAGGRYLLDGGAVWMTDIASTFREKFSSFPVPKFTAPYALMWLMSWWDSDVKATLSSVNAFPKHINAKSKTELGIEYRDPMQSFVAMAESLIAFGLVEGPAGKTVAPGS